MEHAAEFDLYHKQNPESGVVYDSLFIRHWDTFLNPNKYEQLFSATVSHGRLVDEPVNLLRGTQLQAPVAPFGGANDYQFSPDGSIMAFTSRVPSIDQAWQTNLDIFIVPTDGSREPVSVSSFNMGADSAPRFSPDGTKLMWLMMRVLLC
jgi:dipeptidyl aminopeptidase/acylaminoacyl peptidase